jgi:hypothetical protein
MTMFADTSSTNKPAWHAPFLSMMPDIRNQLRIAFRGFPAEARQDAIEESLALALSAFVRLFSLGKTDVAYPTPCWPSSRPDSTVPAGASAEA